jgi:molybdopterin molybdotransferase
MDDSLEQAVAAILAAVPPPQPERVPVAQASGRALLTPLVSPVDLPRFDNSAMDGYAVRAASVAAASKGAPVRLALAGRISAGDVFRGVMPAGACVRLFTGAPLPEGADAVVMQEQTSTETASAGVLVLAPVASGENIRRKGEEVRAGAVLGEPGIRLTAGQLILLCSTGAAQVTVGTRPRVGVLASGTELREPGQELLPGQIYESNRWALADLLKRAGADPKVRSPVPDSLTAIRTALERLLETCDVVVTSGGVSVGEMDFIKQAFQDAGGELEFWRVAIKPGRPVAFGRRGRKLFFGLPGNPVSAFVTFLLLVRPAILRWQGVQDVGLPAHPGVLAQPLENPGDRRHFMRVRVDAFGRVADAGLQASHALGSLAAANGLVDVPPHTTFAPGAAVRVLRWGD